MKVPTYVRRWMLGAIALRTTGTSHAVPFDISLSFGGGMDAYASYFTDAEAYWESQITEYSSNRAPAGIQLEIYAEGFYEGIGGVLGQAGPTTGFRSKRTVYAASGIMQFDLFDVATLVDDGLFQAVIEHEMAHVIGFGTLWENNGLYQPGSGQFTGQNAVSSCISEFPGICGPNASYVPVELGGGPGTAGGHWDELLFGNELMTGYINQSNYVSNTTICSFVDLGYRVTTSVECGTANNNKPKGGGGGRGKKNKIKLFDLEKQSNVVAASEPPSLGLFAMALLVSFLTLLRIERRR